MASRLVGAKPLPEPMLAYCNLDYWEQISVKFDSEFYHIDFKISSARIAVIFFREGGGGGG